MKTIKEMIEVMQAYDRGEKIEVCCGRYEFLDGTPCGNEVKE